MIINITPTDIAKGKRNDCSKCPIAIAVNKSTGKKVMVTETMINIDGYYYNLPDEVQEFIYRFDTKRPVEPFVFELFAL